MLPNKETEFDLEDEEGLMQPAKHRALNTMILWYHGTGEGCFVPRNPEGW